MRRALLFGWVGWLVGCGGTAAPVVERPPAAAPEPAPSAAIETTEVVAPEVSTPDPAVEPEVPPPTEEELAALRAAPRQRLADLPLPRARAHTCDARTFTFTEGDDEEHAEWWEEGSTLDRFDAAGRWTRRDWNSNPVGLSGEVRVSYGRDGAPQRTQEIPFESIDGEPRTPPAIQHTVTTEGDEVVVTSRRGAYVGRVDRYRYDADGRVISISSADAWETAGDPFLTEGPLPEPSGTGCTSAGG